MEDYSMTGGRLPWRQSVAIAVALAVATPAVVASPALGAEDGTVHATVTVGAPCITLDTTSVDFGTVAFNSWRQTDTMFVTNCSGIPVDLLVRGTDATSATSTATWSLYQDSFVDQCAPYAVGPNHYRLSHLEIRDGAASVPPVHLANSDQTVREGVPDAGQHAYKLHLLMPCTGSDGMGETMSFQAIFTATF
jgi:hypothetical protein